MSQPVPLLVFSDLDGTLLDHDTYSWHAARPALDALSAIGAGLVLASSKTTPEMREIQRDVGVAQWPAIVENGAGVLGTEDPDTVEYDDIRRILDTTPHRSAFTGFGDMSAVDVAETTGLPIADATRAKTRAFSEPGLWSGTPDTKKQFLAHLAAQGITAREGGRFLTLSRGKTKADQMAAIITQIRPAHTLALGDAPNDIEMLQTADHGVIIANPHRAPLPDLPAEQSGRISRTTDPGPQGWNTAVLAHLESLKLL